MVCLQTMRGDHAVGLGRSWRSEAVLNIEGCAERVEVMLACHGAFAEAEEPAGELLAARYWVCTTPMQRLMC